MSCRIPATDTTNTGLTTVIEALAHNAKSVAFGTRTRNLRELMIMVPGGQSERHTGLTFSTPDRVSFDVGVDHDRMDVSPTISSAKCGATTP